MSDVGYPYNFVHGPFLIFIINSQSGFYHKLVTTGKENHEPDVIETLPEETVEMEPGTEVALAPRVDVKRRSNRRIYRHHSTKRGKSYNE